MFRRAFALTLLLLPLSSRAESVTITADQWASPRSGEAVAAFANLRQLMVGFNLTPGQQIGIHYAAGESGTLWAEELRSWLVALGVPSRRIVLTASLPRRDIIVVETSP